MNDERPEKLSDININVHGFTADDVIEGRKARNELIRDAALRGCRICIESEWLHAEARMMGIDVTYNEELDDDDLE
jgi:hypothetical protein